MAHVAIAVLNTMLNDRGHSSPLTLVHLGPTDDSSLEGNVYMCDDDDAPMLVFLVPRTKLGITKLRVCLEYHKKKHPEVGNIMFVTEKGMTLDTRYNVQRLSTTLTFEHFLFSELLCNPTQHKYVPLHVRATSEEIAALQRRLCIRNLKELRSKLPSLLRSDIICRYYNFTPQSIIKIVRCFGIMNPQTIFRVVS